MELRHLRYLCAVAEHGTFSEAGRRLHVSQSAISEQIADLEREVGGQLLNRSSGRTRLTPQGQIFLAEARKTLAAADRALEITQSSLLGQVGSLNIGFFLWGAGGFFARIIRDYRKLHPDIKLSLYEMRTPEQMEALLTGKIDIAFARPLEPPFDQTLRAELLYRDPVVVVLPRKHPLAGKPISIDSLATERFVLCDRQMTPALFDAIVALCSAAGFSPNIVNTSSTWSGVLTLVESGEGVALVPSGVRYLRPPGVVISPLVPQNLYMGLSVAWNPQNEDPIQQNFLRLVRENKDRIQRTHGL
ncbi:LysR family transcriptional regulator [Tunturiibacter gelidoferens]|uniref:DNA-binding transcriptional LysR family regulator n=3 Tax=Tunturiibacter TaxID=3154218 RepID=A0A7Y9T8F8_9BACT|nr:LysR family transcriptional regulator [Edaphobacter lichenicola]MBB5340211.1 DNA-binding transcriptional LysR family regulator [Edaphobacter lichenicola]NYF50475.1 DNA-binding transcriptional LysR family regulator [Edaphobacter lichenicola]